MKREIEFRGRTLEGVWKYGWLIKQGAYFFIQNDVGGNAVVIQDTIGQYTGFKDDNGVKIYEGDEVVFGAQKGSRSEVSLSRNMGWFVRDKWGDWKDLYDVVSITNCEVVKN